MRDLMPISKLRELSGSRFGVPPKPNRSVAVGARNAVVRINRRALKIRPRMNANERKSLIRVYLRSFAAIIFSGLSLTSAQTFEVTPKRVMIDESASIRATGLQPNQRVTIRAELVD